MKIGVLALQGDFEKHAQVVKKLGHTCISAKDATSINSCDKLIIPGGESTTIIRLIEKLNLRQTLMDFAKERAVMGTCAGLILLGNPMPKLPFPSLKLIDIQAERNAYGRQIDSFIDTVQLDFDGRKSQMEGVFIRAPKILSAGVSVQPLAYHGQDIVLAKSRNIMVCTFHPELTEDVRVHEYFIQLSW